MAGLSFAPIAGRAQDRQAPPALEDLIPDSAVANPEDWAQQGAPAAPDEDAAVEAMADLDPDAPLAEVPPIDVAWPDNIDLPQLAPLEPDDSIQFADAMDEDEARPGLAEADVVEITPELTLAFPTDPSAFPERAAFAERFGQLSTVAELESDEDNIAQLAARAKADEELLATMLRVYGYFDAQVIRTIGAINPGETNANQQPQVRFDLIPGTRFRFGAVDLGQLLTAPDWQALRRAFEIETGDPLSSDTIVAEQFDLDRALGEMGYPFAAISEPELLVDHARNEGDLTMKVEPGGKFVFGKVNSNLPEFLSGRHLGTIARFDPGDVYQRSLDFDLRRAIISTGLVSTVTVSPRKVRDPVGDQPGEVELDVEMTKAKLRTIAGAIGYGTGEGFRAQASWEHRNLFPPEGMLRLRGIAGTREQLAGVTFRKNNFGGRDEVLTVDAFASTIDSDAYDANTVSLIGTYERLSNLLFQKPLSWSVGLEAVATDERNRVVGGIPRPRQTYFVGAIPLYAMLDTTDDLLDPKRGFRTGLRLSPETSRSQGVQSFYLRGQFDASYYQPVSERVVAAGRVRFASIPGAPLFRIAPSRRLYAGGGGSVRGYGYQRVGPKNDLLEPVGGRSLVEVSAEARIGTKFFDGALSVVPFFDAASVSIDPVPDFRFIKYGAGIGVRYNTGFGPLRLDVATPLNPDEGDSRIAVYISLGQAF
ncbi:Translocation and assembly module TamA precursor [Tsuneonella dongtanensis]|uniref:Translocation and assembly module TamA n=1 Tax=Tsuneonella dongtanensis TaxID=692370 RepID=A0A1B2ACU5_9SPHN|nr:BamA/TamA family outer membrane protein [Tsuneonella dongtanensis]ANY19982.1 Translocation and assembly module TamA precursor [Tsuneonella dongtanensis]